MELKDYQERVLGAFTQWKNELNAAEQKSKAAINALEQLGVDIPPDTRNYPKTAWHKLAETCEITSGSGSYAERTAEAGFPIPHICFKVPTGGGKTLLGAAALERLNKNSGLVLWMVPTNAIYQQTKEKLWSREHPYRQMLERGSGGRVRVLEKDDVFTAADVEHYLCVMLISLQSVNRQNKDFLRMFKDSGKYMSFFPDNDDALGDGRLRNEYPDLDPPDPSRPVAQSLFNVFKKMRPVVILDEAHKAYGRKGSESEEYVQSVNRLNPGMVIELSATPNAAKSNLVVVTGKELHNEEMIKLPVQVTSYTSVDSHHTLGQAHAKLEELQNEAVSLENSEGRYIRPIAVVRVERTGADQRIPGFVHSEDVREYLTENLGVPGDAVAVQSSTRKELAGVDLFSELSPVRWIVTKAALMEGWDCSFAYLLVMLDNTRAKGAITQLVGRVLRQPEARLTKRKSLDQCYVYCQSTGVNEAVHYVKDALEQEGMGDLDDEVHASQATAFKTVAVQRREKFKDVDFFLPKVLHRTVDGGWEELDYQRHILPGIDLKVIGSQDPQGTQPDRPLETRASVDLDECGPSATYYDPQALQVDESVKVAWYARRISDILPNPFQAARVVMELMQRMREAGQDESSIYRQRSALASQLREHVSCAMEQQAEKVFRAKLSGKEIRFDLEATDHNHRIQQSYEILVADNDVLLQQFGKSVQLSLFEPVFAREFNELERKFAFYLDTHKALQWWHRIAVRQQGEYYIRGWRRERIWPDFVALGGEKAGQASFLVFETKGQHLEDYEDTKYKRAVFEMLENAFNGRWLNAGKVAVRDGPAKGVFQLVFDKDGFPDAEQAFARVPGGYTTG